MSYKTISVILQLSTTRNINFENQEQFSKTKLIFFSIEIYLIAITEEQIIENRGGLPLI